MKGEPPVALFSARLVADDGYDRDAFRSAMAAMPAAVADLQARGERLVPHFPALLQDLFAVLFKLVVRVRSEEEAPSSTALNRHILGALLTSPDHEPLRETCTLDATRSARGAVAVARQALDLLRTGEVLLEEELLGLHELAGLDEEVARAQVAQRELEPRATQATNQALARRVAKARSQRDAMARSIDQSLEALPAHFTSQMAQRAEGLSAALDDEDAQVSSFFRELGEPVPAGAQARLRVAEQLRTSEELRRLVNLVGAFRAEARAARRDRSRAGAQEIYQVGRGDDLAHLLPAELSGLTHPLRRRHLLRRLLERDLAVYDLRGPNREGRGPMVVCVDGSGSMAGQRDLWAKAVALALVETAQAQRRGIRVIVFAGRSEPLSQFDLTRKRGLSVSPTSNLDQVLGLASHKPGGGTDFELPLRAAGEALETAGLKRGDVVFITDGEAQVSSTFEREWKALRRRREFRVHALMLDDPRSRNQLAGAAPRAVPDVLTRLADKVTPVSELSRSSARRLFDSL